MRTNIIKIIFTINLYYMISIHSEKTNERIQLIMSYSIYYRCARIITRLYIYKNNANLYKVPKHTINTTTTTISIYCTITARPNSFYTYHIYLIKMILCYFLNKKKLQIRYRFSFYIVLDSGVLTKINIIQTIY